MPEKHKENLLSIFESNTRLERSIIALFEKFEFRDPKRSAMMTSIAWQADLDW